VRKHAVGTIHKKYYSLCYPGEALGSLTPLKTREWTRLFDTAWMPPGFVAPHEFEFDPRALNPATGVSGPARRPAGLALPGDWLNRYSGEPDAGLARGGASLACQ
jgi:hypothetical protein